MANLVLLEFLECLGHLASQVDRKERKESLVSLVKGGRTEKMVTQVQLDSLVLKENPVPQDCLVVMVKEVTKETVVTQGLLDRWCQAPHQLQ